MYCIEAISDLPKSSRAMLSTEILRQISKPFYCTLSENNTILLIRLKGVSCLRKAADNIIQRFDENCFLLYIFYARSSFGFQFNEYRVKPTGSFGTATEC